MTLKALTHWIIYKGYKVRFRERGAEEITGILTTTSTETPTEKPTEIPFVYRVAEMQVRLPEQWLTINEHGWELRRMASPSSPPADVTEAAKPPASTDQGTH